MYHALNIRNRLSQKKIRILVVDDVPFMRHVISSMLQSDPEMIVVGTAKDGKEAVQKTLDLKPDIITLDLEMPRMNGLEALRIIMQKRPTPVLILSAATEQGAKETIKALSLGAVDFIPKNINVTSINIARIKNVLIEKVKEISRKKTIILPFSGKRIDTSDTTILSKFKNITPRINIVAIGSSTGGPRALQDILSTLPSDFPVGGVIVQHMPPHFIAPFAKRLNQESKITVKVARDGDILSKGIFLIAPGKYHLKLTHNESSHIQVNLDPEPANSLHCPSVNEMMLSVASTFSKKALGVILTGMGKDGLEGMRAIKKQNGKTIVQNKESCTVYGMPRVVIEENLADKVLPLSQIASEIMKMI